MDKSLNKVTVRISKAFINDLNSIQEERLNSGIDKKKRSIRALTELLTNHNYWLVIERDIIAFKFSHE